MASYKTYAQLAVQADVQDADLLAAYRGTGPLKSFTAATFVTYLGGKFLTPANNLSDVASAATARTNLAVPPSARLISGGGLVTGGGDLSADRTLTVTNAAAADFRAGTSTALVMTPGDTYAGLAEVALFQNAGVIVTGSTSGTTLDMAAFVDAALMPLTANATLPNPTNPKVGQSGHIRLGQPSSGGPYTLSVGSFWKREGGPTALTVTASATDLLYYEVVTSTYVYYDIKKSPS